MEVITSGNRRYFSYNISVKIFHKNLTVSSFDLYLVCHHLCRFNSNIHCRSKSFNYNVECFQNNIYFLHELSKLMHKIYIKKTDNYS